MSWQDNMVKCLNRSLGAPFLPEGFAKAEIFEQGAQYSTLKGLPPVPERILHLVVGDRDINFDEEGNEIGSSSNVGSAVEWTITKRE